jgi:hypothetical protein
MSTTYLQHHFYKYILVYIVVGTHVNRAVRAAGKGEEAQSTGME